MSLNLKKLQQIIIEETIKVLNEQSKTPPARARDVSLASVAMNMMNPNEKQRRANGIVKRLNMISAKIRNDTPLNNTDINFLNTMNAAKGDKGIKQLYRMMRSQGSRRGTGAFYSAADVEKFKKIADQQVEKQMDYAYSDYDKQLAKLDKYNADKDLETSQQIAQADADYQKTVDAQDLADKIGSLGLKVQGAVTSVLSKLDAAEKKAKTAGQKKAARRKKVSFLVRKARVQQRLNKKIGKSMKDVQKAVAAKQTGKYDRQTYDTILGLQQKLFPKTPDEHDGLFGPKTLSAINAKGGTVKTPGKAEKPKASAADLADFKVGNKSIGSEAEFQQAVKDHNEVARIKSIGGGRITPGNNFSGRYDAEALESWVKKSKAKYGSMGAAFRAFKKAQK